MTIVQNYARQRQIKIAWQVTVTFSSDHKCPSAHRVQREMATTTIDPDNSGQEPTPKDSLGYMCKFFCHIRAGSWVKDFCFLINYILESQKRIVKFLSNRLWVVITRIKLIFCFSSIFEVTANAGIQKQWEWYKTLLVIKKFQKEHCLTTKTILDFTILTEFLIPWDASLLKVTWCDPEGKPGWLGEYQVV